MKKLILPLLILLTVSLAVATTLQGTIYNENLEVEQDVLVEIDTLPQQKYLAKEGTYTFEVPPGKYILTARKSFSEINEDVEIRDGNDGDKFIFDLFLLPDFAEEDDLWQDSEEEFFVEETDDQKEGESNMKYDWWRYALAAVILGYALFRIGKYYRKYGSVRKFRKKMKVENRKTLEQHKRDLKREPGHLEKAIDIIKKHDGRITQKQLRREMLHLSETKVSLILTELEYRGKIEKVKKGRGNVILWKGE